MRKHSINISFKNETLADFLHLAGEIITKMTEHANVFPNVPVPLTQVVAERGAFREVLNSNKSLWIKDFSLV